MNQTVPFPDQQRVPASPGEPDEHPRDGWLRRKHRIGRSQLRRFCDRDWRFACHGVVFKGAVIVPLIRYRYRGANIATPWTPRLTTVSG